MAGSRQTVPSGTASEILDIAERFVQSRGFNGFSYADVSSELGITKAALHYHFPGKAELGQSLVSRYTDRFIAALGAIDAKGMPAPDKLLAYCDLYRATLRGQRMCLCGMLAAEYDTLGEPMRDAIVTFFEHNQTWLAALLETGREAGPCTSPVQPSKLPERSWPPWKGRCWWPGRTETPPSSTLSSTASSSASYQHAPFVLSEGRGPRPGVDVMVQCYVAAPSHPEEEAPVAAFGRPPPDRGDRAQGRWLDDRVG